MKHPQSTGAPVPLFEFVEPDSREVYAAEACLVASERLNERMKHYLRCSIRADASMRAKYSALATELGRLAVDLRHEAGFK